MRDTAGRRVADRAGPPLHAPAQYGVMVATRVIIVLILFSMPIGIVLQALRP
jgi:hypothetical protein